MQLLTTTIDFQFYRLDSEEPFTITAGDYILPDALAFELQKKYPFHVSTIPKLSIDVKRERKSDNSIALMSIGGIGDTLFLLPTAREYKLRGWTVTLIVPRDHMPFISLVNYNKIVQMETCKEDEISCCDAFYSMEPFHINDCRENRYDAIARYCGLDPLYPTQFIMRPHILRDGYPMLKTDKRPCGPYDDKLFHLVYQMSASSVIRTIPWEISKQFLAMLTEKNVRIWLVDRPHKADQIDEFIKDLNGDFINFARISKAPIDLVSLITMADMVIGPDSSCIHIAGALKRPALGIFSAFPPEVVLGNYPTVETIEIDDECKLRDARLRGCFQHGIDPCPVAQEQGQRFSPCWSNLTANHIYSAYRSMIDKT